MGRASLVGAAEEVLRQGRGLLAGVDEQVYRWKDAKARGASIGMHYRHVLEHFQCLFEGMESGRIDYDGRRRSLELETSVDAAVVATDDLIARFRCLAEADLRRPCMVSYSVGPEEESAEADTTVAREVMFCVGHATHHYALLKPLCLQLGVPLPYEFGVAPSTLKHLREREVG